MQSMRLILGYLLRGSGGGFSRLDSQSIDPLRACLHEEVTCVQVNTHANKRNEGRLRLCVCCALSPSRLAAYLIRSWRQSRAERAPLSSSVLKSLRFTQSLGDPLHGLSVVPEWHYVDRPLVNKAELRQRGDYSFRLNSCRVCHTEPDQKRTEHVSFGRDSKNKNKITNMKRALRKSLVFLHSPFPTKPSFVSSQQAAWTKHRHGLWFAGCVETFLMGIYTVYVYIYFF